MQFPSIQKEKKLGQKLNIVKLKKRLLFKTCKSVFATFVAMKKDDSTIQKIQFNFSLTQGFRLSQTSTPISEFGKLC